MHCKQNGTYAVSYTHLDVYKRQGMQRGYALEVAGRIAALAAAYVIEQRGCQEHYYTQAAFRQRYAEAFGLNIPVGTT